MAGLTGLIALGALALFALFVVKGAFKIIGQAEVMVVERLGKFNRIARSGLRFSSAAGCPRADRASRRPRRRARDP